jgi:hypothetical protein
MLRALMICAAFFALAAPAQAATRYVSAGGSDAAACTQAAPCQSFERGYNTAAAGDTISVAAGTYGSQNVPAGTKAVTFLGGPGVIVRSVVTTAQNAVFDGINIDGNNAQLLGVQFSGANSTWKNASIGRIVDEKGMLATSDCVGCTIDNVNYHDVLVVTDGVHNECLYSQAADITIKNSQFSNCATMDVFFTRGTWWGQPGYGGWTLLNNRFGAPRMQNGQCCHYYAVYWAYQTTYDGAVVRGNTFETQVTVDGSFTNSVESCNTPAFNLPGMAKESCGSTPTPTPTPTPSPTATPAPTTTPAPTPTADTQAPSVPQGMAWTTKTADSIGLRWDAASDDRAVAGYRIYRNSTAVGTTTNLNYTVGGLACGTSYTIGLTAFDAAGNESEVAFATGTTSTDACAPAPTPTPTPTSTPTPVPTSTPTPTPTATPTPTPAPSSPDLVGAWSFNETGTSARDSSPLANTGTISGATRVTGGKFGGALSFDGVNDAVSVPDKASLDLTKGMTLEAWVNPVKTSDYRTVIFKENRAAGHQTYSLYGSEGTSKASAEVAIGATYTSQPSTSAIAANTWTHIAATYDGTTLRVFRNGVQVGSKSLPGSLVVSNDPLKFGGNAVWGEWFAGVIDEVRVYKAARTAAQIQSDMVTPIG